MFRLKVSVLFSLLIVLSVVSGYYAVEEQRDEEERSVASGLQRSRLQLERELRLQELELRDVAEVLARGRIRAYLKTLDAFRGELDKVEAAVYEAVPLARFPLGDKEGSELRAAVVRQQTDFLDRFTRTLADELELAEGKRAWQGTTRREFVTKARSELISCAAYAATNCAFQFSYYPLMSEVERVRQGWSERIRLDLAILSDRDGVGLADASNPKYSSDKDLRDRYPLIGAALSGVETRDIIQRDEAGVSYFVAVAVPVRSGDRTLGSVLAGMQLDDEYRRKMNLKLGADVTVVHKPDDPSLENIGEITADAVRGDEITTDEANRVRDAFSSGEPMSDEVSMLLDRILRPEVVLSSLSKEAYGNVVGKDFDCSAPAVMNFRNDRFMAVSVPFLGNYLDDSLRFVLSVDLENALSGYASIQLVIVVFGAALLLIGIALAQVIIQSYARQFEQIDAGIHEVISGNLEHVFAFDMPDELARNMAQSLNLMAAVLTGKPLPDETMGGWGEELPVVSDVPGAAAPGEEEDIAAVGPLSRPCGDERSRELLDEPAEAYYRRIYGEYIAARRQTGEPVDRVTYVNFVEKIVRHERALKERMSCRYVRFDVIVRDGEVVLTPIPIP